MRKLIAIAFVLLAATSGARDRCTDNALRVIDAALDYVGVREATGRNDGTEVEHFQRMTGTKRGDAWCGSFVFTAFVEGGVMVPGGGRAFAWSPSWHPAERQVWTKQRGVNSRFQGKGRKQPMPGDVGGLYYAHLGRYGHVLLLLSDEDKYWKTVEGNTNGAGSREGDGVYLKRRLKNQIDVISRWAC